MRLPFLNEIFLILSSHNDFGGGGGGGGEQKGFSAIKRNRKNLNSNRRSRSLNGRLNDRLQH